MKRVVDKIDRRQRQLYIEVYLLEVRAETIREFGVGGHFGVRRPGGRHRLRQQLAGGEQRHPVRGRARARPPC